MVQYCLRKKPLCGKERQMINWWLKAVDKIYEEKYGDTEDLRFDDWRQQHHFRTRYLLILVIFGLLLLLINTFFFQG